MTLELAWAIIVFLSTLSLRRATDGWEPSGKFFVFLSTLSLRRATHTKGKKRKTNKFLSTLSLRRATHLPHGPASRHSDFYPRSPCGERPLNAEWEYKEMYFYPRSPCGERLPRDCRVHPLVYFYPRSPCGERHFPGSYLVRDSQFLSTLSLRRATTDAGVHHIRYQFLSTLSLRRATYTAICLAPPIPISIHALLAESDNVRITHNPGPC